MSDDPAEEKKLVYGMLFSMKVFTHMKQTTRTLSD